MQFLRLLVLRPGLKIEVESLQVLAVHLRIAFITQTLHYMLSHSVYSVGIATDNGRQTGFINLRQLGYGKAD